MQTVSRISGFHSNKMILTSEAPGAVRPCRFGNRANAGTVCAGLAILVLAAAAPAAITITPAGLVNPPPPVSSATLVPKQTATADTASLVTLSNFKNTLQMVLNAQKFTNDNNWTVDPTAVKLADPTAFNVTNYTLYTNAAAGGNGNSFGETMTFNLDPNPPAPKIPLGSTVTEHWLQWVNSSQKIGTTEAGGTPYGYPIDGLNGFWQLDNGQVDGATAAAPGATFGTGKGPYYDSNNGPTTAAFTPPNFSDSPKYYNGNGFYLHFLTIPTWDVFTPATPARPGILPTPATETIDVADYGISWGFSVTAAAAPEPAALTLVGLVVFPALLSRRRLQSAA